MNDKHLSCILDQANHIYAEKELSHLILWKKLKYMKYGHIPRGYTQVLSKMPFFFLNEAMEFQFFLFRRKDITTIYRCDIIFLKKNYFYGSLENQFIWRAAKAILLM